MASNLFAIDGRDLDSIFELKSDFPNMAGSASGVNYYVGGLDLSDRYLPWLPENISTGYFVAWPATPYIPAWIQEINESGEILRIYHDAQPAQPAGDRDIGTIYTPKGKIANYYNYPSLFWDSNTRTITGSMPDTASGAVTAGAVFNCRVVSTVHNDIDPITQLVVVSTTVNSGHLYQAVSVSGITKTAPKKWQATVTLGISTTTNYVGGSGTSQAKVMVQFYTITASGKRSDAPENPMMQPPLGPQNIMTVTLTHNIDPIYTGD